MLNLITQGAEHIYLACGPTDFRKQIEGLAALVSLRYHLALLFPCLCVPALQPEKELSESPAF